MDNENERRNHARIRFQDSLKGLIEAYFDPTKPHTGHPVDFMTIDDHIKPFLEAGLSLQTVIKNSPVLPPDQEVDTVRIIREHNWGEATKALNREPITEGTSSRPAKVGEAIAILNAYKTQYDNAANDPAMTLSQFKEEAAHAAKAFDHAISIVETEFQLPKTVTNPNLNN